MTVVEKFLMGKYNDDELCEDGIFVSNDYIAVIAGVGIQSAFRYNNKKPGRLIRDVLLEAMQILDKKFDCYQAIEFLNNYIIDYYKRIGIYNTISTDASYQPSASVIIFSRYFNQIWLIGDCIALYGDTILENKLKVDELYKDIRVMIINYLLKTGYTVEQLLEDDVAKRLVQDLEKRQPYIRNKVFNSEFDYAVIDGFNKPNKELIKCIDVPEEVKEIVFTSDGYRKPFYTLKESEDYLKYIKKIDPLCYKEFADEKGFYKNQESYDDRAYIRFKI